MEKIIDFSKSRDIARIKGLRHRYSKTWVVNDINYSIKNNRIVGLLGSNGAGKSTIMNLLCGIITPTKGSIEIGGYDIGINPIKAKSFLGFLPQKPPLYMDLTVNEYLRYCAHLRLIPKSEISRSVVRAKTSCKLQGHGKRLLRNLSGGYQQRVGIAQAIIHKPKLVVLDEPTNGLDPLQINEVRELIREISKSCSVLISTHILSEVQALCNEIVMIEKGNMVFSGTKSEFNNLVKSNILIVGMYSVPDINSIRSIRGVLDATIVDDNSLKLEIENGFDVINDLILRSIDEQWGLFEIYKQKVSLENTFTKLSNRELTKTNYI